MNAYPITLTLKGSNGAGFLGVAVTVLLSALIGGLMLEYTINFWALKKFALMAAPVSYWKCFLVCMLPWIGSIVFPCWIITLVCAFLIGM